MIVEYSSNNSGGGWWLKDKDWKALEKAGWYVIWGGDYFCHSSFSFMKKPEDKPEPCESSNKCPGHRRFDSWKEVGPNRWLGSLAKEATKNFESITDALREFEKITGQDVTAEGCNCCGSPHTFRWGECAVGRCTCPERTTHKNYNYASGDELAVYLYDPKLAGKTKRELLEELKRS